MNKNSEGDESAEKKIEVSDERKGAHCSINQDTISIDESGILYIDIICNKAKEIILHYQLSDGLVLSFSYYINNKKRIPFDLFAGKQKVLLELSKGKQENIILPSTSVFENIAKAAIVWREPVRLSLHIQEYGALLFSKPKNSYQNHIYFDNPSTLKSAQESGVGYLSSFNPDISGTHFDKKNYVYEVYTFFFRDKEELSYEPKGKIKFRVDYYSRGSKAKKPYCGDHDKATVSFYTFFLPIQDEEASYAESSFDSIACNTELDENTRYARKLFVESININQLE